MGEDSERTIWSEVFALPMGDEQRLVVVRGAERLKEPERITAFAKRSKDSHPGTYLVLVSGADEVPRQAPTEEQKFKRSKGDLVPWLDLKTKIHVVEAKGFTADTAQTAVAWVRAKTGMRENVAGYLLNRADGNMRLVRDTCAKISVFGQEATISAINELLSAQPRDTFVDALVAMDKKGALAALERIPVDEYGRVLGLLDSHLDLAGLVHDMTVQRATPYEIARAAGKKNFLVADLIPVSRHYNPKRRAAIRRVMVDADEAVRSGIRTGPMEAVVALW